MVYNSSARVFAAQPYPKQWFQNRSVVYGAGAAAAALLLVGFFMLSSSTNASRSHLEAVEQRLALLERSSSQTKLNLAAEVQRATQEHVSMMVSGMTSVKSYPSVLSLPSHMKRRILVTGGAGFVGSHLVDALMTQGHYVYVLDNLYTGRTKNLQHWIGHPNFQFFQGDVTDPFRVEVDHIYHLACPASPPHYQANPIRTMKTSVVGTMNMLGLAKRTKARLLFTSTSEVYGDPLKLSNGCPLVQHPQAEDYWGNVNTWGPRSCYDEGKRAGETLCYSYHREEGVEVRVARIFNTFGPRMHPNDGRVVSNFIIQSLMGNDLTVYGPGQQTRSFQYVGDLVTGLIKLMNCDYSSPVNIGNPEEYTIIDFATKIQKLIGDSGGAKTNIKHLPSTKDDPQQRRPDTTLAKKVMDWEPGYSVEEGLFHTVDYFREELGLPARASTDADKQYTEKDAFPLWTSSYINGRLTPEERGISNKDISITPKQPE